MDGRPWAKWVRATRDVAAGEVLLLDYGPLSSAAFAAAYGVVPPGVGVDDDEDADGHATSVAGAAQWANPREAVALHSQQSFRRAPRIYLGRRGLLPCC